MRVGIDVVHVPRFAALLARRPALRDRLFTAAELETVAGGGPRQTTARLAARFAVKEATRKALARGDLRWRDIEVRGGVRSPVEVSIAGAPTDLAVSISHDGDTAVAIVLAGGRRCCSRDVGC